jgi:hypothetical protein
MKHPAHLGGDYSRQFDFFMMDPATGPVNSAERNPVGPPQEPYEPKTNINASPAVRPGESTFPTGTSNHSGRPEEPVGSLYLGGDDAEGLEDETFDNDVQVVTSPDEDEEIDRIDDDLREEGIEDLEDEEYDEESFEDELDEENEEESGR